LLDHTLFHVDVVAADCAFFLFGGVAIFGLLLFLCVCVFFFFLEGGQVLLPPFRFLLSVLLAQASKALALPFLMWLLWLVTAAFSK